MPVMTHTPPEAIEATTSSDLRERMCEMLAWFARTGVAQGEVGANEAGAARLAEEVRRLNDELEFTNRQLRRSLAEMERMQAILISTLQSLTIGVLAVGQDGVVIVANPAACRMLDRPLEELAAHTIDTVLPHGEAFHELLLTLQGVGGGQRHVTWSRQQQGMNRQLDLVAVRALPPYDTHLAGLILLEDVTELRRLEQQAQLKSRLTGMGEIAMNLAHEIRNPLGSVALFAGTLAQDLRGNEKLEPLAAHIVAGVNSLEHLVANTLEFARPRRLSMTRVSLRQVLAETLVYVQHPLGQKNVRVKFDHDLAPDAWVAGDAEQLRQVFLNLIINAIQALYDDGSLEVGIDALPDGGWQVRLTDDGIGIPEEMQTQVFDPFFTTREKGSGIGLAIVHNILTAHGAQIELTSRVAAGTTVRVRFPATLPEEQA